MHKVLINDNKHSERSQSPLSREARGRPGMSNSFLDAATTRGLDAVAAQPSILLPSSGEKMTYIERTAIAQPRQPLPTLLLIHSTSETAWAWSAMIAMVDKRTRVIAPTLRGFDTSQGPNAIAAVSEAIVEALGALGIGSTFIAGSSMGARVALAIAARAPTLVDGLVLFGCPTRLPDASSLLRDEPHILQDVRAPTVVVWGTKDAICGLDDQVELMKSLSSARPRSFVEVRDAPHHVIGSHPKACTRAINDFVGNISKLKFEGVL